MSDKATEALEAFGQIKSQYNFLSTATHEECKAYIDRVLDWWNFKGLPIVTGKPTPDYRIK